jgi:hypothetical protein
MTKLSCHINRLDPGRFRRKMNIDRPLIEFLAESLQLERWVL